MTTIEQKSAPLDVALRGFNAVSPKNWLLTGANVRRDLHGLIRYPAMMVPSMQSDIMDVILRDVGRDVHVVDPFVGSGTTMTEAMRRGLPFTGIDINPLAILTCQAKAAVEAGVSLDSAVLTVVEAIKRDFVEDVDISFCKIDKWFTPQQAILLSRFRRAIMQVDDRAKRQCLWVAFAETIRSCSNSRISTYKLHKRPENDVVLPADVCRLFEKNLYDLLDRVAAYRKNRGQRGIDDPSPELLCTDVREAKFEGKSAHYLVITSPPYGDNQTTIPYGQFSYLALNWIPQLDLPRFPIANGLATSSAIDTASLGGSLRDAAWKTRRIERLSNTMKAFFNDAREQGKEKPLRKVGAFLWDYYLALKHVRKMTRGPSHWVVTLGNRTSAGMTIPFDRVCQELIERLGGTRVEVVHRRLPVKRMPNRNSQGMLITAETTLVAAFD